MILDRLRSSYWKTEALPQGRAYFATVDLKFGAETVLTAFDLFFDASCSKPVLTINYESSYQIVSASADQLDLQIDELTEKMVVHTLAAAQYLSELGIYGIEQWEVGQEVLVSKPYKTAVKMYSLSLLGNRLKLIEDSSSRHLPTFFYSVPRGGSTPHATN